MGAQPLGQVPKTIGQIAFDDAFPGRSMEFIHDLHLDDRLTLASVADLADRLPRRSVIADTAAQPLLVPQGGPPRGALDRPGDVIRDLDNANAWLTLLNVEDDPGMAEVMNIHLDQLEAGMIAKQGSRRGKMRRRAAFVFVSSPNSVTPVHFDIEHSLLMQVSGSKTVSMGRFETHAVRRHEFDRYWDGSLGRIENLPPEVTAYTLTPGRAVYIPPGTPHWVHNGPDISLSVTLTYFTAATVRENRIEHFNSRLRRRHLKPREPGRSASVDTAKICAMEVWAMGRRLRAVSVGTKQRDSQDAAAGAGYRVEGSLDSQAFQRAALDRPMRTYRTAVCVAWNIAAWVTAPSRPTTPLPATSRTISRWFGVNRPL
jgi:JmjC domain